MTKISNVFVGEAWRLYEYKTSQPVSLTRRTTVMSETGQRIATDLTARYELQVVFNRFENWRLDVNSFM